MTCTHAALKRRDLVDAGFQYDNILMEESAQILEIETFIPLLCQVHRCTTHHINYSALGTAAVYCDGYVCQSVCPRTYL